MDGLRLIRYLKLTLLLYKIVDLAWLDGNIRVNTPVLTP